MITSVRRDALCKYLLTGYYFSPFGDKRFRDVFKDYFFYNNEVTKVMFLHPTVV